MLQFDGAKKLQFNVFTSDEHASFICCVAMEDTENRVGIFLYVYREQGRFIPI